VRAAGALEVHAVRGLPEVRPGDDLAALVLTALERSRLDLRRWDVVVVTHKVVSKAEGALVDLGTVFPSAEAVELAQRTGGDPRVVEVALRESRRVLRVGLGVLVCETRSGLVCANAGVDRSNVPGADTVTLLPRDPDASAAALRVAWLETAGGGPLGVIVCDSFGRPFREAQVNVAIGVAGMPALTDHRGLPDAGGQLMQASVLATADQIASAAELVMGKVDAVPVALLRGLRWSGEGRGSAELLRDPERDLFRQ
jgi:coenzyme F420-0:L-glutamate ligase / coenzyme F420-1:gamma-L-glutamate ligase